MKYVQQAKLFLCHMYLVWANECYHLSRLNKVWYNFIRCEAKFNHVLTYEGKYYDIEDMIIYTTTSFTLLWPLFTVTNIFLIIDRCRYISIHICNYCSSMEDSPTMHEYYELILVLKCSLRFITIFLGKKKSKLDELIVFNLDNFLQV